MSLIQTGLMRSGYVLADHSRNALILSVFGFKVRGVRPTLQLLRSLTRCWDARTFYKTSTRCVGEHPICACIEYLLPNIFILILSQACRGSVLRAPACELCMVFDVGSRGGSKGLCQSVAWCAALGVVVYASPRQAGRPQQPAAAAAAARARAPS